MDQYDKTKKMLKTFRNGNVWNKLNEGMYGNQTKESKRELTNDEINNEKNAFANSVTKLCEFNDFKLTYDNVTWSGYFPKEKIEWVYSLDADEGVYISCELTQLTKGALELIQKLYGYYIKWSDKWSGEIGVKGTESNY